MYNMGMCVYPHGPTPFFTPLLTLWVGRLLNASRLRIVPVDFVISDFLIRSARRDDNAGLILSRARFVIKFMAF